MKKLFGFMLLCTAFVFMFSSCSEYEENEVSLTKEQVIGTWDVVWGEIEGESIDLPMGAVYIILNEDGTYRTTLFNDTYKGTYKIQGNTIVGITLDHITEYYKFISLDGDNASIDYSNSDKERYKFRAIKR